MLYSRKAVLGSNPNPSARFRREHEGPHIRVDTEEPAVTTAPNRAGRPPYLWLLVMATALLEIMVLGGGSLAAYELGSGAYGPERAVTNYLADQSQGDVSGMMANATFQVGSNPEFFNRSAIVSMMDLPQNRDLHNVKVVSSQAIDAAAESVSVSMIWGGQRRSQTYTVRKDNSGFRDLLFRYWRIVIPFVTIHIALPNQPGPIRVDGITPATSDVSTVQAVSGYHRVTMSSNAFYDSASQVVDGVDSPPTAEFAPAVSSGAVALAAAAVKAAFPTCDVAVSTGCLNHTYSAPNDGRLWFFDLPGYGRVFWTTYTVTLVGDPTSDMKLVVPPDAGKVNASGTCKVTVTIDGTRNYDLAGPWTATLSLEGGRFIADLATDCWATKA